VEWIMFNKIYAQGQCPDDDDFFHAENVSFL
jgi:hypothetical protein